MGLLSMNSEQLRYKMKNLDELLPNIVYNGYITNIIQFFIMLIDFTEFELETIANAMEDYINYDDEKLDTDLLFGGLSVADRVTSINNKIDSILYN